MSIKPKVGDVIELDCASTGWAKFRFGEVLQTFDDGDMFVSGRPDGGDCTFVKPEQVTRVFSLTSHHAPEQPAERPMSQILREGEP